MTPAVEALVTWCEEFSRQPSCQGFSSWLQRLCSDVRAEQAEHPTGAAGPVDQFAALHQQAVQRFRRNRGEA